MSGHPGWQFKICLIGSGFVGKTSIRRKYIGEGFRSNYIPTLGVDFARKTIDFEGTTTDLIIWDIAGQPAFQSLRKRYYDGATGLILAYSVIDKVSFDDATKWLVEAHEFMSEIPPLIIVGNKIDLRPTHPPEQSVTSEEGRAFTESISERLGTEAIFIETSALTGECIDDAFITLTRMMREEADPEYERPAQEMPAEEGEVMSDSSVVFDEAARSVFEIAEESSVSESGSMEVAAQSESISVAAMSTVAPEEQEIDPITSLPKDSSYLQEDDIGRDMARLVDLRSRLKEAEDSLASTNSELEGKLLNLKNVVHVKRIMYEHLLQQLRETRQEWADAYDEYQMIDESKKDELAKRSREIEGLRREIESVGKSIRKRVSELELEDMTRES
ncbi:MAG: GTP-binding protein [Candidatus Thorarchaeota archaeon]|nr:MAG: GTP-binding protein [Candidatus Thorarchaeota archaeon]